ncbi:uncharacterized protein [Populus alba]|uniref:uncharacterized protein isoform X1 n=1 Tax=Populus alba TaxID=43335 RepID=UPI003CC6EEA2
MGFLVFRDFNPVLKIRLSCKDTLCLQRTENLSSVLIFEGKKKKRKLFSIQIPESIQELKKALSVLPQLSSHPKPGCLGETCVFFAVIGAVEGRYRLHMIRNNPDHATVPQLSVQDAIDGIKQVPIDPATCLNWIIKQGVVPESDCPYIGVPQGGHVLKEGRLSMVNGYRFINPGGDRVEGIVEEIMEGGPIVGIISYQSEYLHAVMLIGGVYKDDRVDEYVIHPLPIQCPRSEEDVSHIHPHDHFYKHHQLT